MDFSYRDVSTLLDKVAASRDDEEGKGRGKDDRKDKGNSKDKATTKTRATARTSPTTKTQSLIGRRPINKDVTQISQPQAS